MPAGSRTIVVMPAYNAARTLERVYADIPTDAVDEVIVVDDCSTDDTVAVARRLPVDGHPPRAEHGLRRQPEDVLPRPPSSTARTSW